ncbi:MAG: NfeD family protein [Cyanobacteria bacterium J06650_10]
MLKVNVLESLRKSVNSSIKFGPSRLRFHNSKAYSPMANRYLSSRGTALEPLAADVVGRIKLDGVLWKARLSETAISTVVPRGAGVSILYRDGLTLVVEPSV